jgi:L-lysine 6-transaminase
MKSPRIAPAAVHAALARHMLADGYDMVLDLEKSRGRRMHDSRTGRDYLDLFSFFATLPIGFNHPKLEDPDFLDKLTRAALVNPTNSDIYTTEFAEFVDVFGRVAMRPWLPHSFFIAGGALGVENALKAAMDWKVRQNFRNGVKTEKGHQILHFREAFHGRSGYTVSMTNTADPRKYQYFAKFDWPRVSNPHLRFPVDEAELVRVRKSEADALGEIRRAFAERKDDIAAICIEPIQAEGGDHHFRTEFLEALKSVAHEHDALLIFDEVQTGVGLTGRFWAHEGSASSPISSRSARRCRSAASGRRSYRRGAGQRVQGVEPHQLARGVATWSTWCAASATSRSSRRSGWWRTPLPWAHTCSAVSRRFSPTGRTWSPTHADAA